MPVKRDTEGNVIEVPTRPTRRRGGEADRRNVDVAGPGRPTQVHRSPSPGPHEGAQATGPLAPGAGSHHGIPTTPMQGLRGQGAGATVVRRTPSPSAMSDPPAGWLVVVDGPGKGSVATLGLGVNTIGRDPGANRVAIDHGDPMMSRANHGAIVYDDRNRAFWIRHGDGTNLTYIGDEPVLEVRRLDPFTHIRMGTTVLRFVPLCGESFAWEDDDSPGEG